MIGWGEHSGVLNEGLDIAQRNLALGHPQTADEHDDGVVGVAEQEHHRLDESGDELGLGGGSTKLLVAFVEFLGNGLGAA